MKKGVFIFALLVFVSFAFLSAKSLTSTTSYIQTRGFTFPATVFEVGTGTYLVVDPVNSNNILDATAVVMNGETRSFVDGYVAVPSNWNSRVTIDGNVYTYTVKTSRNNVSLMYLVLFTITLLLSGIFYLKKDYEVVEVVMGLFAASLLFFIPYLLITSGFMFGVLSAHCSTGKEFMYFSGPYGLLINSYDVTSYQMGDGVQERYTFYRAFAKTVTPYTVINGTVFYYDYERVGQIACAGCRTMYNYIIATSIPRTITADGNVFALYNDDKSPKNEVCNLFTRAFFLSLLTGTIVVSFLFYAFSESSV